MTTPTKLTVLAWLRAGALTFLVATQLISAIQARPLDAERLRRPGNRRLIDALVAIAGERVQRGALERWLIDASEALVRARALALLPTNTIFAGLHSHQNWGLFLLTHSVGFRMHIDTRRASETDWVNVYRADQVDGLMLERVLCYRRIRGLYHVHALRGPGLQYAGFVDWLARRLFAADGSLAAVRLRMERIDLSDVTRPPRSAGFEHEQSRLREQLGP